MNTRMKSQMVALRDQASAYGHDLAFTKDPEMGWMYILVEWDGREVWGGGFSLEMTILAAEMTLQDLAHRRRSY